MAESIFGKLLTTLGSAAIDAARLGMSPHQRTGKKKKESNCTPCAARARVEAAKQFAKGHRQ